MMSRNAQLGVNVVSMYLPRFAHVATAFFLFPFIAYHVGLEDYGIWLLVSSTTVFFLLDFGMAVSVIRYVAQADAKGDREAINRVVSSSLAFFAGLGLVLGMGFLSAMTLLLPSLNVDPSKQSMAMTLVAIVVVNNFLIGMPLSVFRNAIAGVNRYALTNLLLLAQLGVRATLIVVLLLSGAGIMAVALVEALTGTTMAIAAMIVAFRVVPGLRVSPKLVSLKLLRSMLPYSTQVFVIGMSSLVILQTDNLIIGAFLPMAAVTLYAAAFRLYGFCRDLTGSAMKALVPDASRSSALGEDTRVRQIFVRGTKYSNALLLLAGVPVMIFAEPLLVLWTGERFAEVATVTQILIASLLVNNNHLVAVSLLMGTGRIGAFARYHVLWAVGNLIISILLIRHIGLVGVALGTAIPIVCLEPLYLRVALRELNVSLRTFLKDAVGRALAPALIPAALLLAAHLIWHPSGLASLLALFLVYAAGFAGTFVATGLDHSERERLGRLGRRLRATRRVGAQPTPAG